MSATDGRSRPDSPIDSPTKWPAGGAVRVHHDPAALPRVGDEPGPHRFDDPRPRTVDRFLVRYAATTIRGCLLELLDWLRDNSEATAREQAVDTSDDPGLVSPASLPRWRAVDDFLAGRQVATVTVTEPRVVSINDAKIQALLDKEPVVRAVLDSEAVRFPPNRGGMDYKE